METDEATASKLMEILFQILDRLTECVRQKTEFCCLADVSSWSLLISFCPEYHPNLPTDLKKAEEETPFKKPNMIQTSQTPAIECERHHESISSDDSDLDIESIKILENEMENLRNAKSG